MDLLQNLAQNKEEVEFIGVLERNSILCLNVNSSLTGSIGLVMYQHITFGTNQEKIKLKC